MGRLHLDRLPLHGKLIALTLLVAVGALVISFGVMITLDIGRVKEALRDNALVIARTAGDHSVAALAFSDRAAAAETLARLEAAPEVLGARLYDVSGAPFADYGAAVRAAPPRAADPTEIEFFADYLAVRLPLNYRGQRYGSIVLEMSTHALKEKTRNYLIVMAVLLAVITTLAYLLASRLQRRISAPILKLAAAFERISTERDYKIRVEHGSADEIGALFTGFNQMLEQVDVHDQARDSAEEALHREKEHAQVTLASIGDGVITTGADGRIAYANPVAESLLGWTLAELRGRPFREAFRVINEFNGEPLPDPVSTCLHEGRTIKITANCLLVTHHGQEIAIEDSCAPIRNRSGAMIGTVVVFHDVSTERALRRQLIHQARHDALTGLVNRSEFETRLEQALQSAHNDDSEHILLYLDLDQFKVVNDTCGHVAGDELLRQITTLLQERLRREDTFARLGGDEFAILLESCPMDQALRVAEMLHGTIRGFRYSWEAVTFDISASIGLVAVTAKSESVIQLLSAADMACYAAKDLGRNRTHVYSSDDAELVTRHTEMRWVGRIRSAIEQDRFRLYQQPIVALTKTQDCPVYHEVLLRMIDEEGRIIPPGVFIPAAEHYNLMPDVDRWVIGQMPALFHGNDTVYSVNLSGASLNNEALLEFTTQEIRAGRIPARRLYIEITETAAITRLSSALRFMRELWQLGVRFSLDDFGSGLSSFGYLRNLPVDHLKIDGSFVRRINESAMDFEMVKAINQLGHVMGKKTVAEAAENEAILAMLRDIGVDYAQGYAIAMPEPCEPKSKTQLRSI